MNVSFESLHEPKAFISQWTTPLPTHPHPLENKIISYFLYKFMFYHMI